MKITNLLTKATILTVCLSLTGGAVAEGKIFPKRGRRLTRNVAARKRVNAAHRSKKSFPYPQGFSREVREMGNLSGAAAQRVIFTDVSWKNAENLVNSTMMAKRTGFKVLDTFGEEKRFYDPEITAADNLYKLVYSVPRLDAQLVQRVKDSVRNDFKNNSLQTYLLQSLEKQDRSMLLLDLSDYFTLKQAPEVAAFNYTSRHPGKKNLMVLRLLNNPLVDQAYKDALSAFFLKPTITRKDYPAFRKAISNAYNQYVERLQAIEKREITWQQVKYVKNLIKELRKFINESPTGKRPEWNTTNELEKELYQQVDWVRLHQHFIHLEPLKSHINKLNQLWESAAPNYLSLEETLELYEKFVKATGRRYPYAVLDDLKEGEISFSQETELWKNLMHWRETEEVPALPVIYEKAMAERNAAAQGQAATPNPVQ